MPITMNTGSRYSRLKSKSETYKISDFEMNSWSNVTGKTIKSSLSFERYIVWIMFASAKQNVIACVKSNTMPMSWAFICIASINTILLSIKYSKSVIEAMITKYFKSCNKNDL